MPVYGRAKIKSMVKGILPSTYRKNAKFAKDHLHRENRRSNKLDLADYKGPAAYVIDMYEDDDRDLTFWEEPHRTHNWDYDIIQSRRNGDKVAPLIRWAYWNTKHIRPEDRLSKMRSILPSTPMGVHALSHLDFLDIQRIVEFRSYANNPLYTREQLEFEMTPYGMRSAPTRRYRSRDYTHPELDANWRKFLNDTLPTYHVEIRSKEGFFFRNPAYHKFNAYLAGRWANAWEAQYQSIVVPFDHHDPEGFIIEVMERWERNNPRWSYNYYNSRTSINPYHIRYWHVIKDYFYTDFSRWLAKQPKED